MMPKSILLLALFACLTFARAWGETVPVSPAQLEAARWVEQMRGFSIQQSAGAPSDGIISPEDKRKQEIVDHLRSLGTDSVPALTAIVRSVVMKMTARLKENPKNSRK